MRFAKYLVRRALRETSKTIVRSVNRKTNYHRIQKEASSRPESVQVPTPAGNIWMSPIESKLYNAMRREGLSPTPQFCIEG